MSGINETERPGIKMKVKDGTRIEKLYTDLRVMGQTRQRDECVSAAQIAYAFAVTVDAMGKLPPEEVTGAFWGGGRKTLQALRDDRIAKRKKFPNDTAAIAAEIGQPRKANESVNNRKWSVARHPELQFKFVEREIVTSRAERPDKRGKYIAGVPPVSADLLLVNAKDATPIVCEVKMGGDQNALFALVQSLAAVAQLTSKPQRERLRAQYAPSFGETTPKLFDVYVMTYAAPTRGIRPELMTMAQERAEELREARSLKKWVRRIAFVEAVADGDSLKFKLAPGDSLIELQR